MSCVIIWGKANDLCPHIIETVISLWQDADK